ncbi:hypothetical protein D3C73_1309440 [compost metagenome]
MPGNVRQHLLQDLSQITEIAILFTRRADARCSFRHMDYDVAITASGLRGGAYQQWLRNALQLINGAHSVVNQQNWGGLWQNSCQAFYRIRNLPGFQRHQ